MSRRLSACFVALAVAGAGRRSRPTRAAADAATLRRRGDRALRLDDVRRQAAVRDVARPRRLHAARRRARSTSRWRASVPPTRASGSARWCSTSAVPATPAPTTLPGFAATMPAAIRARYDLVSFDPRGTGSSRPVECVDDATADRLNAVDPTPNSDAELRVVLRRHRTNRSTSSRAASPATARGWPSVGSRNVARDLDRLRAALGDDTLDYPRLLVRHGDRRGVRADVPRSGRPHGARLARRPLGDAREELRDDSAGLRAGARRLPRRLRRRPRTARSATSGDPAGGAAPRSQTALRAGPHAADRDPTTASDVAARPGSPRSTPR